MPTSSSGLLDAVAEALGRERRAQREQRGVDVDPRAVERRLREARDREPVHLAELLEQAVVGRARTRLVELEPVRLLARARHEPHRREHERRPQLPAVERPHQGARREVQVVGAGLLDDRARLVREPPQPRRVPGGGQVRVERLAPGEQLRALLGRQLAARGDAARDLDLVELVGGQQVHGAAVVQRVLDRPQPTGRHRERYPRPGREVDQAVAQRQVEQGVLPLRDARRHGRPAERPRGGGADVGVDRDGLRHGRAVLARPVLGDRHGPVRGARVRGQRQDARAPGPPHVDDTEHAREVAGEPARVRGVVRLGGRHRARTGGSGRALTRAPGGDERRLDEPDEPQVDEVDDRRDVRHLALCDRRERRLLAPVPQERVTLDEPQQRPHPDVLERRRHRHDRVEAGPDASVEHLLRRADLLPDVRPGRGRLAVPDAARRHRVEHRGDGRVDPLGTLLVARRRGVARPLGEQHARLVDERADRRVVRHDERGQQLHGQHGRDREPLPRRQQVDVHGPLREQVALAEHLHDDLRGPLLLDLQDRRRVEPQVHVGQDGLRVGLEVDELLPRRADAALDVAYLDLHDRAPDRRARVVHRDAAHHGEPVVRHRVREHGRGVDLDRRGRAAHGVGRTAGRGGGRGARGALVRHRVRG